MRQTAHQDISLLHNLRRTFIPVLPQKLSDFPHIAFQERPIQEKTQCLDEVLHLFPHLKKGKSVDLVRCHVHPQPLRLGVVLSGGQASGGHNVISGLFDALKQYHPQSVLIGFLQGPGGIVNNRFQELNQEYIDAYRNQGGFDMIGSGRTKIESPQQFESCLNTVSTLQLDGLVVIGGDDSNTNAAHLAEYFLAHQCTTCVVGVPKTIDGDLQNKEIEISFGFDTACKVYSEIIGNIAKDALSAKKYYYFIKLMGRSASHIALECALRSHPNMVLIGEEIQAQNLSLMEVVDTLCTLVIERAYQGKNYGVVLIPEGIVEFIPEFKALIKELNQLLASSSESSARLEQCQDLSDKVHVVASLLSDNSKNCFAILPAAIQQQLLMERDPHGNVQVSKIETERLLIALVERKLQLLALEGKYQGVFSAQPLFCGYEGRSCLPTNFDSNYCYSLGYTAFLLIAGRFTGYMACVQGLKQDPQDWSIVGIPLIQMMRFEQRDGKKKAVIEKALVDLKSPAFIELSQRRQQWRKDDQYIMCGPIQYFGPKELTETIPYTVYLNRST